MEVNTIYYTVIEVKEFLKNKGDWVPVSMTNGIFEVR